MNHPSPSRPDLDRWVAHLSRFAEPAADPAGVRFLGDLGPLLRACVTGEPVDPPSEAATEGETAFWWALHDDRVPVGDILSRNPSGPLLTQDRFHAIEVWTDAELSALHALWKVARLRDRTDWQSRAMLARDWHLEHTQPDNATNRPWALHVFLLGSTPECTHYAETLLHNCLALEGKPDPASAWILLDASHELVAASHMSR